jgi:hypothetical protein
LPATDPDESESFQAMWLKSNASEEMLAGLGEILETSIKNEDSSLIKFPRISCASLMLKSTEKMEFPTGLDVVALDNKDCILTYVADVADSENVVLMKYEADKVSFLDICGE